MDENPYSPPIPVKPIELPASYPSSSSVQVHPTEQVAEVTDWSGACVHERRSGKWDPWVLGAAVTFFLMGSTTRAA